MNLLEVGPSNMLKIYLIFLKALYAVESNQTAIDSDDNEEYQAVRKISATEEIPDEVKNWLTETFVRTNVIKNIGKLFFEQNEHNAVYFGQFLFT